MYDLKFATRNFLGKAVKHYLVEVRDLPASTPTKQQVGHHVLIVDCSGSMYGDIADIKEKIRKMLTLDEYRDSSMLVSLLSYASNGDLVSHFERVPVADIVKSKNTKAQREIGSLRARGATCMTQAFAAAKKLVHAGELTAVSVHTDGFFNDPSPTAEFRRVDELIEEWKEVPNAFVNTIGYRDWCDFKVLDKIANALSGKCWRATDIKTFYDSIYDTTQILAGQSTPAIYLEKKDADYQVFVSSDGKIVGGAADLTVAGVRADAQKRVYRFKEVTQAEFKKSKAKEEKQVEVGAVFARAQLAEGRVNAAKYAVVSTRLQSVLGEHARALTSPQLAAFAASLEPIIFGGQVYASSGDYGVDVDCPSLPRVIKILSRHLDGFVVDFEHLNARYKRRGLKRLSGKWQDGKLVKPSVRTEVVDDDQWVPVSAFESNRNSATINMRIARPCKLIKDGDEVRELAGVKLKLSDFKQYTILGDGDVCVEWLRVRVASKVLHKELFNAGVAVPNFDPKVGFAIELGRLPLVDYKARFDAEDYEGLADRLVRLHAFDKLLAALTKGKKAEFSAEQVAELGQYYVTPSLYVSLPSAVPYTDLKEAVSRGEVDARPHYEVYVGSPSVLDPSDTHSANKFLNRWYEAVSKDIDEDTDATVQHWYGDDFQLSRKKLGPRVKITVVDRLMAEVFDEFFAKQLGQKRTGLVDKVLGAAFAKKFWKAVDSRGEDLAEVLQEARAKVAEQLDEAYTEEVSPLVAYVGNAGLLPDDFGDVPAMSAEQFAQKYPDASLSKAMRDNGTFFDLGNGVVITVATESTYFTTERGLEAIEEIEKKAAAA